MEVEVQVEKEVYVTLETHRRWRSWRLAVVLFIQNMLIVGCLSLTFYCFWTEQIRETAIANQENTPKNGMGEIYIHFDPITDIAEKVNFMAFDANNMNLSSSKSEIQIFCNGTYMLYVEVYSEGLDGGPGDGTLALKVGDRELASFTVNVTVKDKGCKDSVHHQIVYLRNGENGVLYFTSNKNNLKVCKLTLGLHYLLGNHCQH
ncbi:hypothetical protein DPEC_G00341370 [Dallia pectoralis]|uniref:Uncharacterized protein n=1 Tax=Dallia pectoralis TaxID=75939 RepID=A0ACC2F5I4_DALPE|nr:hypothetical protein DPEC_G00341370 [Dallia pectoralis]